MRATRASRWGAVLAMVAVSCGAGVSSDTSPTADEGRTTVATTEPARPGGAPQPAVGVLPTGPSALDDMFSSEFPEPLVPPREIISGGPPPDGIPPIESPVFLPVLEAGDLLDPEEAVVALEIDGDARAYPVQVMIWHEIVNDVVGGVPVSVTYCPLCNSAVTYERTVRGVETTFGTSGRLFASALVMYDRATESLWTHFDGRAVVGVLTGEELPAVASPLLSWADFRSAYPDGRVLDPNQTGFSRRYGSNPYVGYDVEDSVPFLFRGTLDDRAAAMQRVVGISIDGTARAYSLEAISGGEARATNDALGEIAVAILWKAGQATALETGDIDGGRDVGSVGVFSPVVNGRVLTFVAEGDAFVDEQTRSAWNVAGEALSGELAGTRLERIPHLDTFWFAWATYQSGSDLVES